MALSVVKPLLKRYHKQRERGTEGFGAVILDLDTRELNAYIREAEEKEMMKKLDEWRDKRDMKSNAILFHHRHPTSTPNLAECAHPICVNNAELEYTYFVVHNGIITNDDELKDKHEALGYVYQTEIKKVEKWVTQYEGIEYAKEEQVKFNDSETLAIELCRFIEGKSEKVEARGSIAYVVMQVSRGEAKATKLFWGRNYGNPLYLEVDKYAFCLKSVGSHTNMVVGDKMFSFDYESGETAEVKCELPTYYSRPTTTPSQWVGLPARTPATGITTPMILENDHRRHVDIPFDSTREVPEFEFPAMTFSDYFHDASVTDFTVESLVKDSGSDYEEIQNELLQEYYLVQDLLKFEERLSSPRHENITRLEERRKDLDQMLDELDGYIIERDNEYATSHDRMDEEIDEATRRIGFNTNLT